MADDREGAVREVAQVYELIKINQPLLFTHCSSQPPSPATQLAQSLLGEALRALDIALSVMKQPPAPSGAAAPQLSSPSSAAAADDPEAVTTNMTRRPKRRRSAMEGKHSSSWVNLTTAPYDDGYVWRKYGEKRINGTQFARNYFRCTYKYDKGCQATKHVQQKCNSDPPMFQVTYNNEHTCKCTINASTNSKNLPFVSYGNGSQEVIDPSNGHAIVKQGPQVPPPIVDDSALPSDQMPCQEPFPLSNLLCAQHTIIPSTTSILDSSDISGLSCYEYPGDTAQTMPAAIEPAAEDGHLKELEHFLLYDSIKHD
ncbi:hypothetical protein ACP70R_008073 [Stipagrostis hirtigluma subsp. patula]